MSSQITMMGASSCSGWFCMTETTAVPRFETSAIMNPRLGRGGCTPIPRKLRIISLPAIAPMPNEAVTMMGPVTLGRMWENNSRGVETPTALAASM